MAKTLHEAPLTTRSARAKLPAGVHWRLIDVGVHLGYRRGKRGGEWLVRWRDGVGYKRDGLGQADDVLAADGATVLSFDQAAAAAKRSVDGVKARRAVEAAGPVLTVRSALESYIEAREAHEQAQRGDRPLKRDARSRLTRHVLAAPIAEKPLHELQDDDLRQWRDGLTGLAASTARRLTNDFKAALHAAAESRRDVLPALPGVIKAGLRSRVAMAAPSRDAIQILADGEVQALIAAALAVDEADGWEGDLHRLVALLAATGARFGQVVAMKVGDVETARAVISVPVSAKGRGEKVRSHTPVQVSEDLIAILRPAMAGRKRGEFLLHRWRHKQIGPATWVRTERGPWLSASELARPWRRIVAEAGLPADVVPYALRHSSIVRGLRAGLPVRLVASLHDTSSAMIEKHYAVHIADAETEIARRAILPLTGAQKVVRLAVASE